MKTVGIIKYFIPAACLILYVSGCSPSADKAALAQLEADSISSRYIPDLRMEICDIKVKNGAEDALILKGETTNSQVGDALIKTLSKHGNKIIDSILILPDTAHNKKYTGLATVSVINIRKQPRHSAELVSQAVLGTPVRILKNEDSWFMIKTPDNYIGWTESSSVEPMTIVEMASWQRSDRVMTISNSGWVYTSQSGSGITGDFVAGCIFVKESEGNAFTRVRFPDGREGYITSKFLVDFNGWKKNVECTEVNIVKRAESLIGLPYLWGGTSSRAFDCSGFSQTVYYLNGIIMFRDASLQALHGKEIDITNGFGNLKPGDLIFFGTKENSISHITHVAVYKGDNEYFNSSGRVMINSLDSSRTDYNRRRVNSMLSVKRIIGITDDPGIVRVGSHPWY